MYSTLEDMKSGGAVLNADTTLEYLENETMAYFLEVWKLKKDGTWDGTHSGDGERQLSLNEQIVNVQICIQNYAYKLKYIELTA